MDLKALRLRVLRENIQNSQRMVHKVAYHQADNLVEHTNEAYLMRSGMLELPSLTLLTQE